MIFRYRIKATTNTGLIILKVLMETEQFSLCVCRGAAWGSANSFSCHFFPPGLSRSPTWHFSFCLLLISVLHSLHKRQISWQFILVINQLDAQTLFYSKFISCLYMFRAHVLIVRRSKLYYTATGIITPTECDDTRGCIIQFWPPDDEHMVLETCRGMK